MAQPLAAQIIIGAALHAGDPTDADFPAQLRANALAIAQHANEGSALFKEVTKHLNSTTFKAKLVEVVEKLPGMKGKPSSNRGELVIHTDGQYSDRDGNERLKTLRREDPTVVAMIDKAKSLIGQEVWLTKIKEREDFVAVIAVEPAEAAATPSASTKATKSSSKAPSGVLEDVKATGEGKEGVITLKGHSKPFSTGPTVDDSDARDVAKRLKASVGETVTLTIRGGVVADFSVN